MIGDVKGWIPQIYLDETFPLPHAHPSDWLETDVVARLALIGEEPGPIVAEGETVGFSRLTHFGGSELTIAPEGFAVKTPIPAEATHCCVVFVGDSIGDNVADLVKQLRDIGDDQEGTFDILYYAWDDALFEHVDGVFTAVDEAKSGEQQGELQTIQ